MLQRRRRPDARTATAAGLLALLFVLPARAQEAPPAQPKPDPVLYRVFLRDGGVLISYGEFAHVADRVVISIPIGGSDEEPALHLLSIPQDEVDWERTNAYVRAVRARRYFETRAEADFVQLSREVADRLNRITFVENPAERLALAESARKQLVEWPQAHYGYRAADIADMVSWVDQVVSQMRAAAGMSSFDVALVAHTVPPVPDVQLLPAPSLRERVELALAAAHRTSDAAQRVSLLDALLKALPASKEGGDWVEAVRARASADLAAERRIDRAYASLTSRTLASVGPLVENADVRGVQRAIETVLREDARLEYARPAQITALLATLDQRLDAARRLRLARDAWVLRLPIVKEYWNTIRPGLDRLLGLRSWLGDVRQLAGPAPKSVQRMADVAGKAHGELTAIRAPAEASSAHAMLLNAARLAIRAATSRLDAVRAGDMKIAWQASSAAAGSLMLLDRAVDELRRITQPPTLDWVERQKP